LYLYGIHRQFGVIEVHRIVAFFGEIGKVLFYLVAGHFNLFAPPEANSAP
jgi:hypothetical protein